MFTKFGAFVLSSLPEKQYTRRFNEEFIERRHRALERFINRLAHHSIIRYSDLLIHFLSCEFQVEYEEIEAQEQGTTVRPLEGNDLSYLERITIYRNKTEKER